MTLTFFYAPNSTASTVHWSLEELAIPYEAIRVDITDDDDKKTKLMPVNPNLKVPVLVHDGVAMFESAAIQIYLGETFGVAKGLFPAAGPKRGEAQGWLVWGNVSLGEAVGRWLSNRDDRPDAPPHRLAAAQQAHADIKRLIEMVELKLRDDHLLGRDATLVDIHLVSICQWMQICGFDFKPFARVQAWIERCSARPANQKLMSQSQGL